MEVISSLERDGRQVVGDLRWGVYAVFEGETEDGRVIAEGGVLPADVAVGPTFVQTGFDTLWSGAGSTFVAVSLAFFCLTTIIAYYYMAETNLRFLLGKAATIYIRPLRSTLGSNLTMALQALILVSVVLGAVSTATEAWTLGDIGVGLMAWLNIIGIIILQQPAFKALRDYERQQKAGKDPVFDPRALDITGATFWENYDPTGEKERVTSRT